LSCSRTHRATIFFLFCRLGTDGNNHCKNTFRRYLDSSCLSCVICILGSYFLPSCSICTSGSPPRSGRVGHPAVHKTPHPHPGGRCRGMCHFIFYLRGGNPGLKSGERPHPSTRIRPSYPVHVARFAVSRPWRALLYTPLRD